MPRRCSSTCRDPPIRRSNRLLVCTKMTRLFYWSSRAASLDCAAQSAAELAMRTCTAASVQLREHCRWLRDGERRGRLDEFSRSLQQYHERQFHGHRHRLRARERLLLPALLDGALHPTLNVQRGQQTEPSIAIGPPSAAPMLAVGFAPFAQRYSGRWIAPSPMSPTTEPPFASHA